MFAHITTHWKTSLGGILIALVTVVGVLSQQGITLGQAGTGTVVALIGALATALLGLLAKDPSSTDSGSPTQKIGALVLVALLIALPALQGCTVTQSQLEADGSALSTALSSLAGSIQNQEPQTAAQLREAATAINAAVSSQQTGPAWEEALNAAAAASETILSAIPTTSFYAPLVAIAVVAADTLIGNSKAPAQPAKMMALAPATEGNLIAYRTQGALLLHHRLGRSISGDFKSAWNTKASTLAPAAVVK